MKALLMVTSKCNANCKHCYLPSVESICPERALEMVKELKGKGHEVLIGGGETLLNKDYLKSYEYAGQKYLLTNGKLLSQDKSLYMTLMNHGINELQFSIHFGLEKRLASQPEESVAQLIGESRDKGFKTQVNTMITQANHDKIEQVCSKAASYGADKIQFFRVIPTENYHPAEAMLTEAQRQAVFAQVVAAREKYSKYSLGIKLSGNFGPRPGSKGERMSKENRYCPAGRQLVVIDSGNNVYPCPFLMKEEHIIGTYKEGAITIMKELMRGRRDTCMAYLMNDLK